VAPMCPRPTCTSERPGFASDAESKSVPIDAEVVRKLVRDSRREQGLPENVTAPSVLAKIAVLVTGR
jgi:hypothetical protein